MLGELGGSVIDADALARVATAPGAPALPAIRDRFGPGVFHADGSLDREALAAVVFADRAALSDLEAIVHPHVRRLIGSAVAEAVKVGAIFVVIEAIKLVEGGLAERCDTVWLIECEPATQRQRLSARGHAADDLERRLATQGSDLAERLAGRATRRISTEGSLDEVRERVEEALADALAPVLLEEGVPQGVGVKGEGSAPGWG
jgi:dephospho-CoA kinase